VLQTDNEVLVKQLIQIEKELDTLIDSERYEEILPILEKRARLIKSAARIPDWLINSIREADKKRTEKIKSGMGKISEEISKVKKTEFVLKNYYSIHDAEGGRIDERR